MTVLVTGFGPFDGGSNASERLIEALQARRETLVEHLGAAVELAVLPVDTVAAPVMLAELIETHGPSHLLLTGQAAGRSAVSLEMLAVNMRHFSIPDASGHVLTDARIAENGPKLRRSTWPDPAEAVEAIRLAGIPAQLSDDCGTYLCNQVLYAALHHADERALPMQAMFLHLPLTPEQVTAGERAALRHADCPSLPVTATAKAVEILLARLVRAPVSDKAAVTA